MRSFDTALLNGDCDAAKNIAEPAATRGEPWAQFRMGELLLDDKCASRPLKNLGGAIRWLARAACYRSAITSDPTLFADSRAASTDAAFMLSNIYLIGHRPDLAWYYIERKQRQYTEQEDMHRKISTQLRWIESLMSREKLEAVKKENTDVCSEGRG